MAIEAHGQGGLSGGREGDVCSVDYLNFYSSHFNLIPVVVVSTTLIEFKFEGMVVGEEGGSRKFNPKGIVVFSREVVGCSPPAAGHSPGAATGAVGSPSSGASSRTAGAERWPVVSVHFLDDEYPTYPRREWR